MNEINFKGVFGDKRLDNRAYLIFYSMLAIVEVSIGKLSKKWSEQIAYYRLLNNEKVSEKKFTEYITSHCKSSVEGMEHVLVLQDTSEINFTKHKGRIKQKEGLGPVVHDGDIGFFIHPSLVVEPQEGSILGLSDIHLWNRNFDKTFKKEWKYNKQNIELKESYRWIERAKTSNLLLSEVPMVTVIQDREGDIYQSFAQLTLTTNLNLIVRSSSNRILKDGQKLYKFIETLSAVSNYIIEVEGSMKRQKRQAKVEIRYAKVEIARPTNLSKDTNPPYITLFFVQVKERPESVPEGEKPIEWNLLTTHEVTNPQIAQQIAKWYSMRWLIEELFRVMKSEGLGLESSELESGKGLRKLAIMVMFTAIKVIALKQARDGTTIQRTDKNFNEMEINCLKDILPTLEGKTEKQKNPYSIENLAWATWIIARLGGWKGYKSQRPPGVITLRDGLESFHAFFNGWAFNKKDVYKQ